MWRLNQSINNAFSTFDLSIFLNSCSLSLSLHPPSCGPCRFMRGGTGWAPMWTWSSWPRTCRGCQVGGVLAALQRARCLPDWLCDCGLCSGVCVRVRVCARVFVCVCALVPVCSLAVLWCRRDLPPCCLYPSSSHPKPLPRSFVCLTLLSKVLPAFRFVSLSPCCLFTSPPALPSPSHSNPTHTHTHAHHHQAPSWATC